MASSLKIVLADQHVVFLDGLTAVLSLMGFDVVATTTSGDRLSEFVQIFRPDICVVGDHLCGGGDAALLGALSADPRTKTVVLTADDDPDRMRMAIDVGASGYVHKSRDAATLVDVFHRVTGGEIVVEGSFLRTPKYGRRRTDRNTPPQLQRLANYLTPRELECLALLADGLDTTAMARLLGVSAPTVRSHVQAVLTKLGVHSRLEAASLAIRFGLVASPPDIPRAQGF